MNNPIKIYHLEDYKIMRDGVGFLLKQDPEIEVVGSGKTSESLLSYIKTSPVDVLILDIYLDGFEDFETMDGFSICRIVTRDFPATKVVGHSIYDDANRVEKILKAGATGFVSKKSGFEELIKAVKLAAIGQPYICTETSRKLKNARQFLTGLQDSLKGTSEVFSQREREVIELLSEGLSSKEIAERLHITERTVETHRKNMIEKTNVKNTAGLIAHASALGLLKK